MEKLLETFCSEQFLLFPQCSQKTCKADIFYQPLRTIFKTHGYLILVSGKKLTYNNTSYFQTTYFKLNVIKHTQQKESSPFLQNKKKLGIEEIAC